MFLAIIFIVIGLFILLNTLGLISGNFWGFAWAVIFLAIGIRLLMRKGGCPMCGWKHLEGKMHGRCDCGNEHDQEQHN